MTRKTTSPLTPDQVRQHLRRNGQTLTQWAEAHGYPRESVYRVMSGADKAWRGRAHEIAVALGLKVPDEVTTDVANTTIGERSTPARGRNPQRQAAA